MFDNVTFGFGGGNKSSRKTDDQSSALPFSDATMRAASNFKVDENFTRFLLASTMYGQNSDDTLDLSYKKGDTRPRSRFQRFLEDAWNNKWVQYGIMALAAVGLWRIWFGKGVAKYLNPNEEMLRKWFPNCQRLYDEFGNRIIR